LRHIICAAAAAAKSLQSCPTLCDPIDGSPPGSPIPGILQARTLEWVAISFSNIICAIFEYGLIDPKFEVRLSKNVKEEKLIQKVLLRVWCVRQEGVMGAVPKLLLFSATFFHSFVGRLCWPLVVFSLVNQISGPEMITRKTNTKELRQLMTCVPPKGSPPSQAPAYPLLLYPGLCLHKLLSFYPVS